MNTELILQVIIALSISGLVVVAYQCFESWRYMRRTETELDELIKLVLEEEEAVRLEQKKLEEELNDLLKQLDVERSESGSDKKTPPLM